MRRSKSSIFSYLLIGSLLLFFVINRVMYFKPGLFESVSSTVLYPFVHVHHTLIKPVKTYFHNRTASRELHTRCADLEKECENFRARVIELQALVDYRNDIQELHDFKKRYDAQQGNIVQILAHHITDQKHYVLVDAGSYHGIKPDMVAVHKNVLLGRVVDVYPFYSKVVLTTDSVCKVAAYCTQTKVSGIHEGINQEGVTTLKFVSHLDRVESGDLILSSGDGLVFPRGFGLGTITSVALDGLYYKVDVEPLLDVKKVTHCCLIQKGTST